VEPKITQARRKRERKKQLLLREKERGRGDLRVTVSTEGLCIDLSVYNSGGKISGSRSAREGAITFFASYKETYWGNKEKP